MYSGLIIVKVLIVLTIFTVFGCSESRRFAVDSNSKGKNAVQPVFAKARNEQRPRWLQEYDPVTVLIRSGMDDEAIVAIHDYNRRYPDKEAMGLMDLLGIYRKRNDSENIFNTFEELLSTEHRGKFAFSTDIRDVSEHLLECERRGLTESVERCRRFILQNGNSVVNSQILPLPEPESEREQQLYCLAYIACATNVANVELTKRCLGAIESVPNRNCYLNLMTAYAYGSIREKSSANRLLDLVLSQNPPQDVRQKAEAYREIVRSFRPLPQRLH